MSRLVHMPLLLVALAGLAPLTGYAPVESFEVESTAVEVIATRQRLKASFDPERLEAERQARRGEVLAAMEAPPVDVAAYRAAAARYPLVLATAATGGDGTAAAGSAAPPGLEVGHRVFRWASWALCAAILSAVAWLSWRDRRAVPTPLRR